MEKLSKKVVEKIKKEKIKPIPKWRFILRHSLLWILFTANLIFGALGFAIIIYLTANNDAFSEFTLAENLWQWIFLSIPIAWILLTISLLIISYLYFKNTDRGYKFTAIKIFLFNICATLILGLIIYESGFSEKVNNIFLKSIPFYSHTLDTRSQVWMRPEQGYLAGDIESINKQDETLTLKDLDENNWSVDYSNSQIRHSVNLEIGERIKILGETEDNDTFIASEIRPWTGQGRKMQEN